MISIIKQPHSLMLSGNSIPLVLYTDNMYSTQGVAAEMILYVSSIASDGDKIIIEYDDVSLTFTGKTTPDNSGMQFSVDFSDQEEFTKEVVNTLKSNYQLISGFNISRTGNEITLKSKKEGDAYTLNLASGSYSGINELINTGGVTPIIRDFYKILVQTVNIDEDKVYEDTYDPDNQLQIVHDAAAYLRKNTNILDAFSLSPVDYLNDRSGILVSYQLRYAEMYGFPPEVKKVTVLSNAKALPGGMAKSMQGLLNGKGYSLVSVLYTNKAFLTFHKGDKPIFLDEITRLYYIMYRSDFSYIKLFVNFIFDSNENLIHCLKTDITEQYNLYEAYLNPETLLSYAETELSNAGISGNLIRMNVWIEGGDTDDTTTSVSVDQNLNVIKDNDMISELKNYDISYRNYLQKEQFIFQNSYGVYDSLITVRDGEQNASIDRKYKVNALPYDYTQMLKQEQNYENKLQKSYTVGTNWFSEKNIPFFLDFLNSTQVYIIKNNELFPVSVITKKVSFEKIKDRYSFFFEYQVDEDNYIADETLEIGRSTED